MNGLETDLPKGKETRYFSVVDILTDFQKFIRQKTNERPARLSMVAGREEEVISILIKVINKSPYDNIVSFSNAIHYLVSIDQQRILFSDDSLESPKTPDFIMLRKTLIDFLTYYKIDF